MTDLIEKCREQAEKLHLGVIYGGNQNMLNQVARTASLVEQFSDLTGSNRDVVVAAAWLHKCFEAKRINNGQAMTEAEVLNLAGPRVLFVVKELMTEPEDKKKSKRDQWIEKANWAKGLSSAAREILLAEKIINFETTRDRMKRDFEQLTHGVDMPKNDDPKSKPAWHREYVETRFLMVDAIGHYTNRRLYCMANRARYEALANISLIEEHEAFTPDIAYLRAQKENGGR